MANVNANITELTELLNITPEEQNIMLVGNHGMEIPQDAAYAPQGTGTGTNIYNITVTSGTIGNDYDARRAAQIMAEELGSIKSFQSMAVGG